MMVIEQPLNRKYHSNSTGRRGSEGNLVCWTFVGGRAVLGLMLGMQAERGR